jgi:hypothetical protein
MFAMPSTANAAGRGHVRAYHGRAAHGRVYHVPYRGRVYQGYRFGPGYHPWVHRYHYGWWNQYVPPLPPPVPLVP